MGCQATGRPRLRGLLYALQFGMSSFRSTCLPSFLHPSHKSIQHFTCRDAASPRRHCCTAEDSAVIFFAEASSGHEQREAPREARIISASDTEPEIAALPDGRIIASNSLPAVLVPQVQVNKLELFASQPGCLAWWCHCSSRPAEGCGRAAGCRPIVLCGSGPAFHWVHLSSLGRTPWGSAARNRAM